VRARSRFQLAILLKATLIEAMARLSLLLVATLAGLVQGFVRGASAGSELAKTKGFVKALHFNHRLRVCNAYPYSVSLDIFRAKDRLTDSPMTYKSCRDFAQPMKAGDKLQFRFGDAIAGTFMVSDLPENDAVLLLVIHRHDALSTAVSFESHVFANLMNAQVAIIDTYKGAAKASPRIKDAAVKSAKEQARSEELRYDSVVAVNPGSYEVDLEGTDGKIVSKTSLVALNRESYVIIRTGVESKTGPAYPQELLVYPNSDPSGLRSGAASNCAVVATLAALLSLFA